MNHINKYNLMENIQYEFSWGKLCFTEDWEKKKEISKNFQSS